MAARSTSKPKPPPQPQKSPAIPLTLYGTVLLAVVLLFLFVAPYLGTVLFAALIAYIFSPVYRFLLRKTHRTPIALSLTLVTAFLAAILPITFILIITVNQVQSLVSQVNSGELVFGSTHVQEITERGVERVNAVTTLLPGGEHPQISKEEFTAKLKELNGKLLNGLVDFIKATGTAIFGLITNLILAMFLITGMLKYQRELVDFFKSISPFDNSINNLFLDRAGVMTKAMVIGQFIIAGVQGFLAAGSLWLMGIGFFWFFLTLLVFLSFIPLGAGIVTIPIGIIMILGGNVWAGIFIILFHVLVVTNADNFLRPLLVPKSARLNSGLLLLAVFSGMAIFGAVGVVFGPVIMISIISALEIYAQYNKGQARPKLLET